MRPIIKSKMSLSKLIFDVGHYHRTSVSNKAKKRCVQGCWTEEVKKTCGKRWGYRVTLLKLKIGG